VKKEKWAKVRYEKIAYSIRHFSGRNFAGGRQAATPTLIMLSVFVVHSLFLFLPCFPLLSL